MNDMLCRAPTHLWQNIRSPSVGIAAAIIDFLNGGDFLLVRVDAGCQLFKAANEAGPVQRGKLVPENVFETL